MSGLFSPFAPYIAGALTLIAATFGMWLGGKRAGRNDERRKAQEKDRENSDRIRDDVRLNRDDRLRQYDDAGYRD